MKSNPKASPKQKSISEDSPAKTFRLPTKENASVLPDREADSSLSSQNSSLPQSLDGFLSKTFPDSSTQTTEKISEPCSPNWMSSGIAYHGEYWTQNTLEHPNDVAASILSEVLETSAPLRYFLDKEQLESLLNRAEARTTPMPLEKEHRVSDYYSIQHAGIGRKPSAGPQAKGYRNDGETYTCDSRGSSDAICQTHASFRVRETPGISGRLDSRRWTALGNAVCVPVIEWIARRIVEVDKAQNS